MKHRSIYFFYLPLLLLLLSGCYKYKELDQMEEPAYLRVFNSVAVNPDLLEGNNISTFFTFLMDPETDEKGIPTDAAIKTDFFTTRELYSSSYPVNSGNSSEGHYVVDQFGRKQFSNTPVNFEYPGNAHVLTAPAINGFDMSAWAQVRSGQHRIVFVVRPRNTIPFPQLSTVIRSQIVIDTVVNYEKGEVYTMQIVCRNIDKAEYGLYLRKESFVHQAFEENKIYVGFVNLSGQRPRMADLGYKNVFPEKVAIRYSYFTYENAPVRRYVPLAGYYNNYYSTLTKKMDTAISYMTLPQLPREAFFDRDTLRPYYRVDDRTTIGRVPNTIPYAEFSFSDGDQPSGVNGNYTVHALANPTVFNTYCYGPYVRSQENQAYVNMMPLLNKIVSANSRYHIYSTLNIMEIVYDRIYMMQIQRAFNEVPQ
jgi:hypothetical protein